MRKYSTVILLYILPLTLLSQVEDSLQIAKKIDSILLNANELRLNGKLDEALPVAETAARLARSTWGEMHVLYASAIHRLASIHSGQKDYEKAEELYLKAIRIRKELLPSLHNDYRGSVYNLAKLYSSIGKADKAEPLLLELLDIDSIRVGTQHPDYISLLTNLSYVYWAQGKFDKAQVLAERVRSFREITIGKENPDYLLALYGAANTSLNNNDFETAEKHYKEYIDLANKINATQHPDYAVVINTLGILYLQEGDFHRAEPLLLEAIDLKAKAVGEEDPSYATSIDNLGNLYLETGNFVQANKLLTQAKNIREKALGKEHPHYAASLNNLAVLYQKLGNTEEAQKLLIESLEIKTRTMPPGHPEYGKTLDNLATLYMDMGQLDSAEVLYLRALDIQKNSVGENHLYYAISLSNLASVYQKKHEYTLAESLMLQSLSKIEHQTGKWTQLYADGLNNLAILKWEIIQLDTAALLLRDVFEIEHGLLREGALYLSEQELTEYVHSFEVLQDAINSFTYLTSRDKPDMTRLCYNSSLFYNGFILEEIQRVKRMAQTDSSSKALFLSLSAYHVNLAEQQTRPKELIDSFEILRLLEVSNETEKALIRHVSGIGEAIRPIDWKAIQSSLAFDEAAVEFIRFQLYDKNPADSILYAALVLRSKDNSPHFIPLFEERELRRLLPEAGVQDAIWIKDLYANRNELSQLIWQPLMPLLNGIKTIYYSPAGMLHQINPNALHDSSGKAMLSDYTWTRVSTTRKLSELPDRSGTVASEGIREIRSADIYGGITYDMDSLNYVVSNHFPSVQNTGTFSDDVTEQNIEVDSTLITRGFVQRVWQALPGSGKEAREVHEILTKAGIDAALYSGYQGSEETVKRTGIAKPSPWILHLATHGFSFPDPGHLQPLEKEKDVPIFKTVSDPMMRSGLILAGGNYYWRNHRSLANTEDGVLVANEVRNLNLYNTRLAVLSACQSGLGDILGSEGVYGLQRAFRIAGVKSLIVSLWQVPDEQTRELMLLFYTNWLREDMSLRDAFYAAQRKMQEKHRNPYLWAGFVLIE